MKWLFSFHFYKSSCFSFHKLTFTAEKQIFSLQIKSNQTYIFLTPNFTFALKILHKDQLFYGVSVYLNLYTKVME